jgi:hypothetical protein
VLEKILDAMDGIACAVDADHRIVAVGRREWDRLAAENGAPGLPPDSLVGRHLFEFVVEPGMRQAYRVLADRIISTGEPAVITARCDSAGAAREVRLSIGRLPLPDNGPGLLFQARIVTDAVRPRLDTFDLNALLAALKQQSDLPIVTMCSFCRQFRPPGSSDENDWISSDEYYRLGGSSRVRVSHGLCADCDAARFPDL